ncbi:sarcosine oxidase subunit gamma family protein, partial [Curvivirga aplysinae]|uniref:sarcosine oxidase subunit gamma family protein n=1 Tax=Curvivirga aplysinae TaxID=2529852 RepID=UPI0012BCF912
MVEALALERQDRHGDMSLALSNLSISLLRNTGIAMIQKAQPVTKDQVIALSDEMNFTLPMENCRVVTDEQGAEICSISPTTWFVQSDFDKISSYTQQVNNLGHGRSIIATDMSDQIICLEVFGVGAIELFSKGCSLDFRKSMFPVGSSARSLLGQANVIFNHIAVDKYHLLLDVSLLDYLW